MRGPETAARRQRRASIGSVVDVIVGLRVHGRERISDFLDYFVASDGRPWLSAGIRSTGGAPVTQASPAVSQSTARTVLLGGPSPALLSASTRYSYSTPRSWLSRTASVATDVPTSSHPPSPERRRWMW